MRHHPHTEAQTEARDRFTTKRRRCSPLSRLLVNAAFFPLTLTLTCADTGWQTSCQSTEESHQDICSTTVQTNQELSIGRRANVAMNTFCFCQ